MKKIDKILRIGIFIFEHAFILIIPIWVLSLIFPDLMDNIFFKSLLIIPLSLFFISLLIIFGWMIYIFTCDEFSKELKQRIKKGQNKKKAFILAFMKWFVVFIVLIIVCVLKLFIQP